MNTGHLPNQTRNPSVYKAAYLYVALLFLALFLGRTYAEEIIPDASLVYKKFDENSLKLHIFYPPNHKISDQRSAIVFFSGGGWVTESSAQFYPQSKYLASKGMVAVSAEYRTERKYGTSPRESVKDGKSAIRWIRSHAAELGINPKKIAAGGGSAGGHVALAAATIREFEENDEDRDISSKPDLLILFNPIIDTGPGGYGFQRVKNYWKDISPIHNLSAHMPPAIIFLGTNDKHVPVATAEAFKRIMSGYGVNCELVLYEGQGHGFFNYRPNDKYFRETIKAAERFLRSNGFIDHEDHDDAPLLKKEK